MNNLSTAHMSVPGSETTQKLTRLWEELLGVKMVGPDQNYFDLGGDSSLAVQLFARIEKIFHVKLPLATLFEAPTIEELTRVLQRETALPGWSPLVPIQASGSRPNFFCIHGAGGNVLIYRDLSRRLGADQPFYGLQSQGLDGTCAPLTKIEDMAALYAKEIRRLQPHGPYFIGGYCMGGTIAYEVARQIELEGEQIALLTLFDTMDWSQIKVPGMIARAYHEAERLLFHAANFLKLDSSGKSKFFHEKMESLRNRLPVWKGMLRARFGYPRNAAPSEAWILGNIWKANDRACLYYKPQRLHGRVTDFRPEKQYRIYHRPDVKWDRLADGGEQVVVLPVYPAGMLVEPFVEHMAVALRKAMDSAISASAVQKI
jgi:phthiocerol/phenolphthiocerol synthesis type-I polyketide synthase E